MTTPRDPVLRRARDLALAYSASCSVLSALAIRAPDLFRRIFGYPPGADAFYERWGFQMLGYSVVFGVAAARPTPATLSAAAALAAVEIPADSSAIRRVAGPRRLWHPFGAVSNGLALALFVIAARRAGKGERTS